MSVSREKFGTAAAVISGLSFATLAIFSKLAAASVTSVLFWRFIGATLTFFAYLALRRKLIKYDAVTVGKLLLMGALGYGSMSAFFLMAVERVSASLASMLLYLYPAFVSLLSIVLRRERMDWRKATALVTAMTGLVLVLGTSFKGIDLGGIIFGVGAAVVYTIYIVAGSKVIKPLDPINSTMYIMLGAAVVYALYHLSAGSLIVGFSPDTWLVLLGIILISTVFGVLCFWLGVQNIGPTKTSIISTVEPLFTVILAYLVFGERLLIPQLLGGLLIIGSIIILQYPFDTAKGQENKAAAG